MLQNSNDIFQNNVGIEMKQTDVHFEQIPGMSNKLY